jgi:hypothetical protein
VSGAENSSANHHPTNEHYHPHQRDYRYDSDVPFSAREARSTGVGFH